MLKCVSGHTEQVAQGDSGQISQSPCTMPRFHGSGLCCVTGCSVPSICWKLITLPVSDSLRHCLSQTHFYLLFFFFCIKIVDPGGSDNKESACNVGDLGSIPGLEKSPGGEQSNPLSILAWRIPMDGGAWQAAAHGVSKSRTRLSN